MLNSHPLLFPPPSLPCPASPPSCASLPPPLPLQQPPWTSRSSSSSSDDPAARCHVAHDLPPDLLQGADPPLDSIGTFKSAGTPSKSFLNLLDSRTQRSVDCIQCVEGFNSDAMSHCVPEWDSSGRDLDVMLEHTDLFSANSKGGRLDPGLAKKSDLAFVPEHDFEELCWEDGQLLVVMQGLSNKNKTKSWQEDELFSWLQHSLDENLDKSCADVLIDPSSPNFPVKTCEPVHHTVQHDDPMYSMNSELSTLEPPSKNIALDGCSRLAASTGLVPAHASGQGDSKYNDTSELTESHTTPCSVTTSRVQSENNGQVVMMPQPPMQSADLGSAVGPPFQGASASVMNFSHFSRPAAAIKANLHSIGVASGPTGTERLRQLDRVSADVCNFEHVISSKDANVGAYRGESDTVTSNPGVLQSVGASSCHPLPNILANKQGKLAVAVTSNVGISGTVGASSGRLSSNISKRKQGHSAMVVHEASGNSGIAGNSTGWNSISSVAVGTERSIEVLEVAEPTVTTSSGGSGDTDNKEGKKDGVVAVGLKRRACDVEDSECQSKDPDDDYGDTKKAAADRSASKRTRAAENHNQSERRRRDRIKEKMRALQELIPNANKTDKASMLEEAIEYMKSLQTQLQIMAYRSGVSLSPMLIPQGMQQVQHVQLPAVPHMGIGMNMGMGMGMGMGILDSAVTAAPNQFLQMRGHPGSLIPTVPVSSLQTSGIPVAALPVPGVGRSGVVPITPAQLFVPAKAATGNPQTPMGHKPLYSLQHQQPVQIAAKGTYDPLKPRQRQLPKS